MAILVDRQQALPNPSQTISQSSPSSHSLPSSNPPTDPLSSSESSSSTISPSSEWQVVLRQPSGKVVLYNSYSNRLSVHSTPPEPDLDDHQQSPSPNALSSLISTLNSDPAANANPTTSTSLLLSGSNSLVRPHKTYCPLCLQLLVLPTTSRPAQPTSHAENTPAPSLRRNNYQCALPAPNQLPSSSTWSGSPSRSITKQAYFRLLSRTSTPFSSQPITPGEPNSPSASLDSGSPGSPLETLPRPPLEQVEEPLGDSKRVDGYYDRFFVEEMKLGRGQKGSVFLCTHMLDGNPLGHYAVKKIAVGQSSPELLHVLSEVRFLESLRHRNISQYHHAWIEKAQLSRFGPRVPVLYILMDYANGGSLDDYISLRKGLKSSSQPFANPSTSVEPDEDLQRRRQEKERFRQMKTTHATVRSEQAAGASSQPLPAWSVVGVAPMQFPSEAKFSPVDRPVGWAVHLFGLEEILSMFEDTCRGLGFLHSKGILHHDLKTENVLLNWESDDAMVPTALISDFGSSVSQTENWRRERTGRTGTLDWVPPESLKKDPRTGRLYEVTQKGDMWQLGLLLHCLCFFRLPYRESEDIDKLEAEIKCYPGFLVPTFSEIFSDASGRPPAPDPQHSSRSDLPQSLLQLLADLLCLDPRLRPNCETVLRCINSIRELSSARVANKTNLDSEAVFSNSVSRHRSSSERKRAMVVRRSRVASGTEVSLGSALVKRRKSFDSSFSITGTQFETLGGPLVVPITVAHVDATNGGHSTAVRRPYYSGASPNKRLRTSEGKAVKLVGGDKLREEQPMRFGLLPMTSSTSRPGHLSPTRVLAAWIGLGIGVKSGILILYRQSASDSAYVMLILTMMNTVELVICDWRVSAIVTVAEMVFATWPLYSMELMVNGPPGSLFT